ncbi:hypothetical protein HanPI659440_Chr04g0167131 [Helianthus annuus]|nr:hypothetical protein HanPI659440_Chr04g0167131 [Helianthus annuus]
MLFNRLFIEVKSNLLDNLFREFGDCICRINNTLTESCVMYPESEQLKKKALEWKEIILKHLKVEGEEENERVDAEKGHSSVRFEEENVVEADKSVNLRQGSVAFDKDNTPATMKNNEGLSQNTSRFSPMTSSFVAEVDKAIEEGCSEKTPETRFNVLGLQALNLSKSLDNVWTDEERSEVRQPVVRDKTPRPKRTIILPVALRSPYIKRIVSLRDGREKAEDTLA